ncbi:MAG: fibronectin type III domain-containing protein, partial [Dermatophilaceae bacterium]
MVTRTRWSGARHTTLSRPGLAIALLALLVSLGGVPLAPTATGVAPATDLSGSLVVLNAQAPALTVDKQVATHQTIASSSISSPSMTTSQAGELVLAFIMSDGSATTQQSFSSVTGGGLTWRLRQRSNARRGTSEIWQAVAPTAVSNMVVTARRSSGSYGGSMVVSAFIGASTSVDGTTIAAAGRSGAPTATLSPTKTGSWVWGAGNDWDRAAARTVGANQTMADEYQASVGKTFWVQRQTAPSTSGSLTPVTINDTVPTNDRWNLAAIEILPAAVTSPPTDTTPPVVSAVAGSAVGPTQATITWTTNEPASTQVDYGATSAYGTSTTPNTALTTSHSQGLSGLTASTTYHYRVRSADASGNATTSPDATFATAAPSSFNPGNPTGSAPVPPGMGLE